MRPCMPHMPVAQGSPCNVFWIYGLHASRLLVWQVAAALRKGDKADGCVTIVVERQLEREAVLAGERERTRPDY